LRALPGARAVVVENGSGDDSAAQLEAGLRREDLGDVAELRVSPRNTGFAGGINFALAGEPADRPLPDLVYLLNSDAFAAPGSLRALVEFLRAHPEVGICGSYIHGTDGVPHHTAFRFPTLLGEFIDRVPLWPFTRLLLRYATALGLPEVPTRVDWLAGASMLIRREVFDAIGRFDDGFFLYYEETDFCRRAADAGFETWYVPASRVAHLGSKSTGFQNLANPRPAYWFESRRRYFRKHHGGLYLAAANFAWVTSFLLGRLRGRIKGIPERDPPNLFRDFLRHNFGAARRSS
jgi:GT2 family glycosyltransferase